MVSRYFLRLSPFQVPIKSKLDSIWSLMTENKPTCWRYSGSFFKISTSNVFVSESSSKYDLGAENDSGFKILHLKHELRLIVKV